MSLLQFKIRALAYYLHCKDAKKTQAMLYKSSPEKLAKTPVTPEDILSLVRIWRKFGTLTPDCFTETISNNNTSNVMAEFDSNNYFEGFLEDEKMEIDRFLLERYVMFFDQHSEKRSNNILFSNMLRKLHSDNCRLKAIENRLTIYCGFEINDSSQSFNQKMMSHIVKLINEKYSLNEEESFHKKGKPKSIFKNINYHFVHPHLTSSLHSNIDLSCLNDEVIHQNSRKRKHNVIENEELPETSTESNSNWRCVIEEIKSCKKRKKPSTESMELEENSTDSNNIVITNITTLREEQFQSLSDLVNIDEETMPVKQVS